MRIFNTIRSRSNKYGVAPKNERTLDGIQFDSKKEMQRYGELKLLERGGLIKNLQIHPRFTLQRSFTKGLRKFRAIEYEADFEYFDCLKQKVIVEDTKGVQTKEFKIKQKMFEYCFPNLTIEIL